MPKLLSETVHKQRKGVLVQLNPVWKGLRWELDFTDLQ